MLPQMRGEKLQLAVARVLADAATIREATPLVLEKLCEGLGWARAELWEWSEPERKLTCAKVSNAGRTDPSFDEVSRQLLLAPGEGLPGRIWRTRSPEWIDDVR